jgi:hypothetical protein
MTLALAATAVTLTPEVLQALSLLLTEAPQFLSGGEQVWNDLATFFGLGAKLGIIQVPAAQLTAMNQALAASQAGQAAAQAAAGPKPA